MFFYKFLYLCTNPRVLKIYNKPSMLVDKHVLLRYHVLNKCFRNKYKEYTIDDLVDECNKALRRIDKQEVSKRTIKMTSI